MAFDVRAGFFQQLAILNSAGTSSFARPATKTKIDRAHDRRRHRQPAGVERAHEVNSPARRIIFVTRFEISRTRGEAEPAVNAGQRLLLIEEASGSSGGVVPPLLWSAE